MKQLLLIVILSFVFSGTAFAVVNINTATQSELENLQGIGPAKAKAIIQYRERNGLFQSNADLNKVSGVGPSMVKRLHKEITVGK